VLDSETRAPRTDSSTENRRASYPRLGLSRLSFFFNQGASVCFQKPREMSAVDIISNERLIKSKL